jgi:hypothetical protein
MGRIAPLIRIANPSADVLSAPVFRASPAADKLRKQPLGLTCSGSKRRHACGRRQQRYNHCNILIGRDCAHCPTSRSAHNAFVNVNAYGRLVSHQAI